MALFTSTFSHDLFKKYTIVFGSLFDGIHHQIRDDDGKMLSEITVPVTYAPKEKVLARLKGDANLDRPMAISLPIISFQLLNLNYAPARKLATTNQIIIRDQNDSSVVRSVYNPVPYDFHYQVIVYAKMLSDGSRIIEQILPFFTPDYVPSVYLLTDMEVKADIPIVLNSVQHQEEYEGADWMTVRASLWTLDFTLKGFLYGPVKNGAVIKFVEVNFKDWIHRDKTLAKITVQPGMKSDGTPTSNVAQSISYSLINATDDFEYITVVQEWPDV